MKREIKFRFWLGHTKKMTYEHTLIEISHAHWDFTEDIIPLQFTGLLDKNGNEIYEGDIIKYKFITPYDTKEFTSSVFWDEFMWLTDEHSLNRIVHIEVIGNIYETPSLLTP